MQKISKMYQYFKETKDLDTIYIKKLLIKTVKIILNKDLIIKFKSINKK